MIKIRNFPLGLKIIVAVILFYILFLFLTNTILLSVSAACYAIKGFLSGRIYLTGPRSFSEFFFYNVIRPIGFILLLIGGIGLIFLKNWARVLIITFFIAQIIGFILVGYSKNYIALSHLIPAAIVIMPIVFVIYYFLRKRTKEVFTK